jgi:hypothetical protein
VALAGEGGSGSSANNASGVGAVGSAEAALEGSVRRLRKLLDATLGYVDAVVGGKTPADEAAGRAIAEAVAAVPAASDGGALERGLAGNMQDLLMVVRGYRGYRGMGTSGSTMGRRLRPSCQPVCLTAPALSPTPPSSYLAPPPPTAQTYLSHLTQAQIKLAERIAGLAAPVTA